jgi:hypothetical protein
MYLYIFDDTVKRKTSASVQIVSDKLILQLSLN